MARSRAGRYLGFTKKCNIVHLKHGANIDAWCARHAAYVCECVTCGRLFHTARPHTRHCSTACKQYAYRQRAKQNDPVTLQNAR